MRPASAPGAAPAAPAATSGYDVLEGMLNEPSHAPADPVLERAQALREASAVLERAAAARARGMVWFAEQLFSAAELLIGPDSLSTLAPLFRTNAPERVHTPVQRFAADAQAQPQFAGRSEEDAPVRAAAPAQQATLAGRLQLPEGGQALGVVTLDPVDAPERAPAPRRRVLEQRNRQFQPRVLVVPVGSTVVFPNFDPLYHNVFSRSPAHPFDLGLYRGGEGPEVTFDKPGVIKLGCNLHLNMTGYVVVVSSPHYSVTDHEGRFRFDKLQPGVYLLRAWSERRAEPFTQRISLKPQHNTLDVALPGAPEPDTIVDKFGAIRAVR
jgi:plastocyanin